MGGEREAGRADAAVPGHLGAHPSRQRSTMASHMTLSRCRDHPRAARPPAPRTAAHVRPGASARKKSAVASFEGGGAAGRGASRRWWSRARAAAPAARDRAPILRDHAASAMSSALGPTRTLPLPSPQWGSPAASNAARRRRCEARCAAAQRSAAPPPARRRGAWERRAFSHARRPVRAAAATLARAPYLGGVRRACALW